MSQFTRFTDTRSGPLVMWAVAALVTVLALIFVISGLAAGAGQLDKRAVTVAQSELAPLIRQRSIPRALRERVAELLARSELGFNYVTLRNANGVILVSQGRYESLADWLPGGQARQLRGLLYRISSDDQRITLRRAGAVVGYMDYGISLQAIGVQAPIRTWAGLLLGLAALLAVVWLAPSAWQALRLWQQTPSDAASSQAEPAMQPRQTVAAAPADSADSVDPLAALADMTDRLGVALLTVDHGGGIKRLNTHAERLLGAAAPGLRGQPAENALALVDEQGHALASPLHKCLYSEGETYRQRVWLRRQDHPPIGIELIATALAPPYNAAAAMLFWDADQSMRTESRAEELAGMAEILLSRIEEGAIVADVEGRIVYASSACSALLGYTREGLKGMPVAELLPQAFAGGIRQARDWTEASAVQSDGASLPVMVSNAALRWNQRAAHVVIIRPATAQVGLPAAPGSPGSASQRDYLSGLAGRQRLMERIGRVLADDASAQGWLLMMVDVVDFKRVNRDFGRDVGDRVLTAFAHVLGAAVERADTVARLGGDEFAVLVSADDERAVARALQAAFVQPLRHEGLEVTLRVDIGMARAGTTADAQAWLQQAEAALYTAKAAGNGEACLYTPDMRHAESEPPQANALRRALASGSLTLRLWPLQHADARNRVAGAVVQIEWPSTDDAPLADRVLLERAQALGLLGEVGAWCARRLAQEHANWRDIGLAVVPMLLPAIPELVTAGLMREAWDAMAERHRIPDAALILQMPQENGVDYNKLNAPAGMRLALESRFEASPARCADVLCLSPAIVADLPQTAAATAAKALSGYGRKHRKPVLAGPVANQAQYKSLADAGIDYLYGEAISQPLAGRAFGRYLARHGSDPL